MFTVMLLDDEPIILDKLTNIIDWEQHGCKIVAKSENSVTALELALKYRPQIIFSDIYMPLMNGIEFAQHIKEALPESLVILISGYNEFDYARQAITTGVFRYLLKPLKAEELLAALAAAKKRIQAKNREKAEKERLRAILKENLPRLQEKFFTDLIEGELEPAYFQRQLAFLGLDPKGDRFGIIRIQLDDYARLCKRSKEADLHLYCFHLLNMLESEIKKISPFCYCFIHKPREIVVVYSLASTGEEEKIYQVVLMVQNRCQKTYNITFSAGFGRLYPALQDIRISYHEARLALDFKVWAGKNALIPYNDLRKTNSGRLIYFDYDTFSSLLREGDPDKTSLFIDKTFLTLEEGENKTNSHLYLVVFDLINQILRSLLEFGNTVEEVFGPGFNPLAEVNNYDTIDDLKSWIKELAGRAVNCNNEHKQVLRKNFVEKARNFLEENYSDPELTLKSVAEHVYVSSCYLSRLFKDVTGTTVIQYLNKIRIKKAKELLKKTNLRVYEIAGRIGYKNSHYFGVLFKKMTGLSPGDYRNKVIVDLSFERFDHYPCSDRSPSAG